MKIDDNTKRILRAGGEEQFKKDISNFLKHIVQTISFKVTDFFVYDDLVRLSVSSEDAAKYRDIRIDNYRRLATGLALGVIEFQDVIVM